MDDTAPQSQCPCQIIVECSCCCNESPSGQTDIHEAAIAMRMFGWIVVFTVKGDNWFCPACQDYESEQTILGIRHTQIHGAEPGE